MSDALQAFEEELIQYIMRKDAFHKKEAVRALSPVAEDVGLDAGKELDSLLEHHEYLFHEDDANNRLFIPRSSYFNGAKFRIRPTRFEIDRQVLVPGHRFIPFHSPVLFPSALKLQEAGGEHPLESVPLQCEIERVAGYHTFMGSGGMLDYFAADHQGNANVISSGSVDGVITINVFDMGSFYKRNHFSEGDQLEINVLDWLKGVYEIGVLSQETQAEEQADGKRWIQAFEDALQMVFNQFDCYVEIPEQISQACFQMDRKFLSSPLFSLDEFQEKTEKVRIKVLGGHTVLCNIEEGGKEESDGEEIEIPDSVMISQGRTGSLDEILEEIQQPVKTPLLEGFMFDELRQGGDSLENVLCRSLGENPVSFVDQGQEAVFMNLIEEMWESVNERYNREADAKTGVIRERILGIFELRLQWLRYLEAEEIDKDRLPMDQFNALAANDAQLTTMLSTLNAERHDVSESEFEKILDAVEEMENTQRSMIDQINQKVLLDAPDSPTSFKTDWQ